LFWIGRANYRFRRDRGGRQLFRRMHGTGSVAASCRFGVHYSKIFAIAKLFLLWRG
jgi:hypothetical protein